jgi:hypothetical protein
MQNSKVYDLSPKYKAQMSNEIQNPNFKYLTFNYLSFICHFDFDIWILRYWFLLFHFKF